jgi:hypothetical protein
MRVRYLGTALALVAAAVIHSVTEPPARPRPVKPTARVTATRAHSATATAVLGEAARLGLTAAQQRRLAGLATEWEHDAAGPEAEVRQAVAEFERFMSEAQDAGGTKLDEIRRRSLAVQAHSAVLAELRRLHSARVLATLDDDQRGRLGQRGAMKTGGPR